MSTNIVRLRQQQSLHYLNSLPSKQPKAAISKIEAELLLSRISKSSCSIFKNVVLLVSQNGHIAMGFNKVQDCLRAKVPELSNSYISRLLKATSIYLKLDPSMNHIDRLSESSLRPLQDISIEDAEKVWKLVITNAGKRITSRDIKRAMEALNIKASESVSKSEVILSLTQRKSVAKQARTVADLISPNINSRAEWTQYIKMLYKHLLEVCPIVDEQEEAA